MDNEDGRNASSRSESTGLRRGIERKLLAHTWSEVGGSGLSEWFERIGIARGWGERQATSLVRGLISGGCIASGVVMIVLRGIGLALVGSGLLLCGVTFGMLCICSFIHESVVDGNFDGGCLDLVPGITTMLHAFAVCFVACMLPAFTILGFEKDRLYLMGYVGIIGYMVDTLILKAHLRFKFIYGMPPWLVHTCLFIMGKSDFKKLGSITTGFVSDVGHDLLLLSVTALMCCTIIGVSRVGVFTHHRPFAHRGADEA